MEFSEVFEDDDFNFDVTKEIDAITRDTRRDVLEDALSRVGTLNECWDVFRQTIVETVVDEDVFKNLVVDSRKQVARAVFEGEHERLVNIAANKLITRSRAEVLEKAARLLLQDHESLSEVKHLAVALLREQLKGDVETQVKAQLKSDPAFIEDVKRELKRQIMGI